MSIKFFETRVISKTNRIPLCQESLDTWFHDEIMFIMHCGFLSEVIVYVINEVIECR